MIFAAETEERTLNVYLNEAAAVAACEGLDVEAGTWLFWSDDGTPLEPVFTIPNKRGLFSVMNGAYHLVPAKELHHAHLEEAVDEILNFECAAPLHNALGVKAHLSAAKSAYGPRSRRELSSPGESHPQALPEPYVNLSIHTAPIVQSS